MKKYSEVAEAELIRINSARPLRRETVAVARILAALLLALALAPARAQDISATNTNVCKDWQGTSKEFDPKQLTSQDEHYIWVGGTHGKVYKIDAQTGQILIKTAAPLQVYGMALSGDGKLWVGAGGGGFGFIDTTKCVDQASCDAAQVCTATCSVRPATAISWPVPVRASSCICWSEASTS